MYMNNIFTITAEHIQCRNRICQFFSDNDDEFFSNGVTKMNIEKKEKEIFEEVFPFYYRTLSLKVIDETDTHLTYEIRNIYFGMTEPPKN